MKPILTIILIAIGACLSGLSIGNWNSLRLSAKNPNSSVLLRTEINQTNLTANKVLYNPGSGVAEYNMTVHNQAQNTYQGTIPLGTARRYFGLKKRIGTSPAELVPVYYDGTALPVLANLTKVSDDPANDQGTNNLDIVADYVSFSDTKLYTAIQNRGGGFSTGNIFSGYYTYMNIIANPADDPDDPDTIVWALNRMSVPGYTPGLYKITGTGTEDLIRIGDIESTIITGSNLLVMSCNIADLLADADFASWYNPTNPIFGMISITNKTTVIPFATVQQDGTMGGNVYPHKLYIDPGNSNPLILNQRLVIDPDELYFAMEYLDSDQNFPPNPPRIQIESSGSFHDLDTPSLDFSTTVPYRTANLLTILPESNLERFRVWYSDSPDYDLTSDWMDYSFFHGIKSPENLTLQKTPTGILLAWDAVTESLEGTPLTPSRYVVDSSLDTGFSAPDAFQTAIPSLSLPVSSDRRFYRVRAEKDIP